MNHTACAAMCGKGTNVALKSAAKVCGEIVLSYNYRFPWQPKVLFGFHMLKFKSHHINVAANA
jgi:hypothetical protein